MQTITVVNAAGQTVAFSVDGPSDLRGVVLRQRIESGELSEVVKPKAAPKPKASDTK